jgi:hypothetical protein
VGNFEFSRALRRWESSIWVDRDAFNNGDHHNPIAASDRLPTGSTGVLVEPRAKWLQVLIVTQDLPRYFLGVWARQDDLVVLTIKVCELTSFHQKKALPEAPPNVHTCDNHNLLDAIAARENASTASAAS